MKKILTSLAALVALATMIAMLIAPVAHISEVAVERLQVNDYHGNVWFFAGDYLLGVWHNNMTTSGQHYLSERCFNTSYTGAVWNYIAVGTGTDDGNPHNNAALITEADRQLATFYHPSSDTTQWGLNFTFTFTTAKTIKEAGVLNAASNGILTFYVGNLNLGVDANTQLKICWKGTTSGY